MVSRDFLGQLDHLVRRGPLESLAKMEWQGLLVPGDPLVLMELWGPWAILDPWDPEDLQGKKEREDHLENLELLDLQGLLASLQASTWPPYLL